MTKAGPHPHADERCRLQESDCYWVYDTKASIGGFHRIGQRPNRQDGQLTLVVFATEGRLPDWKRGIGGNGRWRLGTADRALREVIAPFVMAPINTKNVHRSNMLMNFAYDEMILSGPGDKRREVAERIVRANCAEAPGQGGNPGEDERRAGFYDILFVAEAGLTQPLHYAVRCDERPGYGSTSRMIAEIALALFDCEREGGAWTPAALIGHGLADRLATYAAVRFGTDAP